MENLSKKKLCVMIVDHNLDFGITLAAENLSHERVVHGEATAWIG